MKHINAKITGRVQGVWFRGSTQRKARLLGLKGYVCNRPGGSVYLEAEGDAAALQALIEWCRQGPELAIVEKVEVEEGEWKNFETFEVRR
ncbi:MAG: acylphosphatase [Saprospiraceae bacterium]